LKGCKSLGALGRCQPFKLVQQVLLLLEPALERLVDGTRRGSEPPLEDGSGERGRGLSLALLLRDELVDVLRDGLVERELVRVASLAGRVFDVIGEILSLNDVNLPEMLRDAAIDPRRLEDYLDQIDRINPDKLREYEKATGIALARAHVDFSGFQQRNLEVEERRLMPKYVEDHFLATAKRIGLRVEPRADGLWRVEHVLADLRSERLASVQKLGKAESEYRKITFHKTILEQDQHLDAVLLGPGHPLYAAVDEKLNETAQGAVGGTAIFMDAKAASPYRLHFFEITIKGKDSRGNDVPLYAEVVAVREESDQRELVPADLLIDLVPHPHEKGTGSDQDDRCLSPFRADPQAASDFLKSTYQVEVRQRCQRERQQLTQIIREYLERSFKARISKAQNRYMTLLGELGQRPEYKLAADEARRHVDDLERSRKERLATLDRLQIARTAPVRHLGTAVVFPPDANVAQIMEQWGIATDPESRRRKELAAEKIAVDDLVAEGFPREQIQRVAHEKLTGFDYRAHRALDATLGTMEVRRVEVKGYTQGNPIQLENSEWNKAQQLGDTYWLYVVWNPLGAGARLVKIQNPYGVLEHAVKHREIIRRDEISAEAIDKCGLPSK
jgi:hypothetical protein